MNREKPRYFILTCRTFSKRYHHQFQKHMQHSSGDRSHQPRHSTIHSYMILLDVYRLLILSLRHPSFRLVRYKTSTSFHQRRKHHHLPTRLLIRLLSASLFRSIQKSLLPCTSFPYQLLVPLPQPLLLLVLPSPGIYMSDQQHLEIKHPVCYPNACHDHIRILT